MASSSPNHATTAIDGERDGRRLTDALGAPSVNSTKDTHKASEISNTQFTHGAEHSYNAERVHDTKEATHAVFETPELLEMILSYLSTKDLTGSLAVSKYWHQSSHSTIALRRRLFLEPVPMDEHIYYDPVYSGGWISISKVLHEPDEHCVTIIEPHPVLRPHCEDIDGRFYCCIEIGWMDCNRLRAVHPSTLLFQPPLEKVEVTCRTVGTLWNAKILQQTGGVTFGALLRTFNSLRYGDEVEVRPPWQHLNPVTSRSYEDGCKIFLLATNVLTSESKMVKTLRTAREALAKA